MLVQRELRLLVVGNVVQLQKTTETSLSSQVGDINGHTLSTSGVIQIDVSIDVQNSISSRIIVGGNVQQEQGNNEIDYQVTIDCEYNQTFSPNRSDMKYW